MALTIDHGKQILPINSRELTVENDFSNSHIGNEKFVTDNSVIHHHYNSSTEQRSITSGSSLEASSFLSELSWKSSPLCFVFEMMCRRIGDWRKFAINLEVDYLIRDFVKEERFREINKKINKCIDEKIQTSKEQLNIDWFYWRNILLRIGERDLVDDIEDKHPNLLTDDRIDLSDVDHQIINGFAIIAHYADRPENFHYLPVKFNDEIKICLVFPKLRNNVSTMGKDETTIDIVIIGSSVSGKQRLAKRFTKNYFDPQAYKDVLNFDVRHLEVEVDQTKIKVQIWSLPGLCLDIFDHFLLEAMGVIITYDITKNWEELETIENCFQKFLRLENNGLFNENTAIMLVGTKLDLEHNREVKTEWGKDIADRHSCMFMETSALDNINVEEAFKRVIRKAQEIRKVRKEKGEKVETKKNEALKKC